MHGFSDNIENITLGNENFRKVIYTSKFSQLVVMKLKPLEEIGKEIHDVDQFFRIEKGQGKLIIDGNEHTVSEGFAMIVPAGAQHNVINLSKTDDLRLYTLYCPPHHKDGTIHPTKNDAEKDSEHFDGKTTE